MHNYTYNMVKKYWESFIPDNICQYILVVSTPSPKVQLLQWTEATELRFKQKLHYYELYQNIATNIYHLIKYYYKQGRNILWSKSIFDNK